VTFGLHGLEGSGQSRYVKGLVDALGARGWRAVVMHFRGCSGLNNRLARAYQWWLLRSLRAKTRNKFTRLLPSPIDLSRLDKLRSF